MIYTGHTSKEIKREKQMDTQKKNTLKFIVKM